MEAEVAEMFINEKEGVFCTAWDIHNPETPLLTDNLTALGIGNCV
jgi:hypothetical protein